MREYFRSIGCLVIDAADIVRTCEAWVSAHQSESATYADSWRVYGAMEGWPIDPVAAQLRDGEVDAVVELALRSRKLFDGWTWLWHLGDAIRTSAEVRTRLRAAGITRDDLQRWNDQFERVYDLIYSGKTKIKPVPLEMECALRPIERSPNTPTEDPERSAAIARVLNDSFPTAIGDYRFVLHKVWDDLRAEVETYRLDEDREQADSRIVYTRLADPTESDVDTLVRSLRARLAEFAHITPDEIALLAQHEVGLVPFDRPRPVPPELAEVVEREFRLLVDTVDGGEEIASAAMIDADGALRVVRSRREAGWPDNESEDEVSVVLLAADQVAAPDAPARLRERLTSAVRLTALEAWLDGKPSFAVNDPFYDGDTGSWEGWDGEDEDEDW